MSDISPRRRTAGRALMAAGLLALPLTATISYASIPEAPAAPAASAVAATVPAPPAPPAPPLPVAMQVAPDVELEVDEELDGERKVHVVRKVERHGDGDDAKEIHRERRVVFMGDEGKLSKEEREKILEDLRKGLDEADLEIEKAMKEVRIAKIEMDGAKHGMTKVAIECRGGDKGAEWRSEDGKTITRLCTSEVMASALEGLKEARAEIARSKEMDAEMRAEVLKALDEKIAAWKSRN